MVQDPRQLRHIFSHLEENNLFLIQTAQEAEEAAEAATAKLNHSIAQVPFTSIICPSYILWPRLAGGGINTEHRAHG